ncbi:MAG TPA: hypothetical protein VMF09_05630 [Solirubrobacteraceae bacterium]|nr:hypothetical protein [Solirubrobacteraceae bacterium]
MKALVMTVNVPVASNAIAPPAPRPLKALVVPSPPARLSTNVLAITVNDAVPGLTSGSKSIAPPSALEAPSASVNPESDTEIDENVPVISKIRLLWSASIFSSDAPGPMIVKFFSTAIAPLVSEMVPVTPDSNSTVSPDPAAAITARKEPAPESLRLVTMSVAADAAAGEPKAHTATSTRPTPEPNIPFRNRIRTPAPDRPQG